MTSPSRRWLPALAALNAVLAVAFGAFAAHALADPQARAWAATGSAYQLPHAVAVFALLAWRDDAAVRRAAWALSLGALLFAGSLYALALGLPRAIAAGAPAGGTLLLGGWGLVGWAAVRR